MRVHQYMPACFIYNCNEYSTYVDAYIYNNLTCAKVHYNIYSTYKTLVHLSIIAIICM